MNNCVFFGRLTKDVALQLVNGTSISKFTIAVNRRKKDDPADFLNIVAFGKQAEVIANNFSKGSQILVQTRVQTGSYDNKDGNKVYTTDFILEKFDFVGSKQSSPQQQGGSFDYEMTPVEYDEVPF